MTALQKYIRVILFIFATGNGILAVGQSQFSVLAGANFTMFGYREPKSTKPRTRNNIDTTVFSPASGGGWHAGLSYLSGSGTVAFKGAVLFCESAAFSSYTHSYSSLSPGGGGSSTSHGELREQFRIIGTQLGLSVSASPILKFFIGCSPWLLVDVQKQDKGYSNSYFYIATSPPVNTSGIYNYDTHSSSKKTYSPYGINAVIGITAYPHERVHLTAAFSRNFTTIYLHDQPHNGFLNQVDLSLGYVFLH